jgi:hypothetical protein
MHLLGISDFLRCINLIFLLFSFFDATLWTEIQRACSLCIFFLVLQFSSLVCFSFSSFSCIQILEVKYSCFSSFPLLFSLIFMLKLDSVMHS